MSKKGAAGGMIRGEPGASATGGRVAKSRRLDSHQHGPTYEIGAFLRSSHVGVKGVWGGSNPPPRLSQSRMQGHYTTNPIGDGARDRLILPSRPPRLYD